MHYEHAAATFFASYESAKTLLAHALPAAAPGPAIHAIASAGAEMASCFVLTPAEVIKQNAQVLQGSSTSGRSSSLQALHILRQKEGSVSRTLWRGYTALVVRNLPFTAMQFPMFEYLRGQIWRWRQQQDSRIAAYAAPGSTMSDGEAAGMHDSLRPLLLETGLVTGSAASVSGSLAATITTPADIVKTRVMLGGVDLRNNSGLDVARAIVREKGIRGLFRGGMLRATWAALGSGLYLGSYEVTKVWLKDRSLQEPSSA